MTRQTRSTTTENDRSHPDRRTVLRSVGASAVAGPAGLGDRSWWSRSGEAGPGSTRPSSVQAPECPNPIGDAVTVTVAGENHEVQVQKVDVPGTCEDLNAFIDAGGMDDLSKYGYAPDEGPSPFSGHLGELRSRANADLPDDGPDVPRHPSWVEPDCDDGAYSEFEKRRKDVIKQTEGRGGKAAHASTTFGVNIYGMPVDELEIIEDPKTGDYRYLHPDDEYRGINLEDVSNEDRRLRIRERRVSVIKNHLDGVVSRTGRDKDRPYRIDPTSFDFDVEADPVIKIPQWKPSCSVSEECREMWCSWVQGLVEHEKRHAKDHIEIAKELEGKLQDSGEYQFADAGEVGNRQVALEDELLFWERMQGWLYRKIEEARCLQYEKGLETHEESGWAGPSLNCEKCDDCGEQGNQEAQLSGMGLGMSPEKCELPTRPLSEFERWRLHVSYAWGVVVDSTDEGTQRMYKVQRQNYEGTFRLEAPESGFLQDVFSVLEGVVSWLDGLDDWINLIPGVNVNLVPDDFDVGSAGFYQGTGEVSAKHFKEMFLADDENWSITRTTESASGATREHATLDVRSSENEYLVSFPGVEFPGISRSWGSNPGSQTASKRTILVSSPDAAIDQGSAESTFPVEDCQQCLSNEISNDLWAGIDTQRVLVNTEGEGPPNGRELLQWQAVPVPKGEPWDVEVPDEPLGEPESEERTETDDDSDGGSSEGPVACVDVAGAPFDQYDASGTVYLCDFEYPDVFDSSKETGDPVSILMFRRTFDEYDSAVVFRLQVQLPDEREGKREEEIETEDPTVETIEFGDRKAYVDQQAEFDGPLGAVQYIVRMPYEVEDGKVRYFGHLFSGYVGAASGEEEVPSEKCESAIATVMHDVVTSVTPNPETEFGSTLVNPLDDD